MEKKSRKEKLTEELSKITSLLTQAGIIVSMLTGAVFWINTQFSLSETYAQKIAVMASDRVLSELPLTAPSIDTVLHGKVDAYLELTESLYLLAEDGLNSQDSIFLILQYLDTTLIKINRKTLNHGYAIDSLHSVLTAGFTDVGKRYEQDSIRIAYEALQARWRFSQLMERARKDNAALLRELRDTGKPKRLKQFKPKRVF